MSSLVFSLVPPSNQSFNQEMKVSTKKKSEFSNLKEKRWIDLLIMLNKVIIIIG